MSEGRSELKYALPAERRLELLERAAAYVQVDGHALPLEDVLPDQRIPDGSATRGYVVHTLYFDDLALGGYSRRLARDRIRNRIRIRTYGAPGDDAPVFLEAKRKLGRRVIKHRVRVGGALAWAQADPDAPWITAAQRLDGEARRAAQRWIDVVESEALRTVASTHYIREVFVNGTERLTLDHRITAHPAPDLLHFQSPGPVPLLPEGWLVLELKFNGDEPAWMRALVRDLRLMSEPISKFALGVALSHRNDRPGEIRLLTPPTILRAQRGGAA